MYDARHRSVQVSKNTRWTGAVSKFTIYNLGFVTEWGNILGLEHMDIFEIC